MATDDDKKEVESKVAQEIKYAGIQIANAILTLAKAVRYHADNHNPNGQRNRGYE